MDDTFWLLWHGRHARVNGSQDIEQVVLLIRYIDFPRKCIVVHRAKRSTCEQLMYFSCLHVYRINASPQSRDIDFYYSSSALLPLPARLYLLKSSRGTIKRAMTKT